MPSLSDVSSFVFMLFYCYTHYLFCLFPLMYFSILFHSVLPFFPFFLFHAILYYSFSLITIPSFCLSLSGWQKAFKDTSQYVVGELSALESEQRHIDARAARVEKRLRYLMDTGTPSPITLEKLFWQIEHTYTCTYTHVHSGRFFFFLKRERIFEAPHPCSWMLHDEKLGGYKRRGCGVREEEEEEKGENGWVERERGELCISGMWEEGRPLWAGVIREPFMGEMITVRDSEAPAEVSTTAVCQPQPANLHSIEHCAQPCTATHTHTYTPSFPKYISGLHWYAV